MKRLLVVFMIVFLLVSLSVFFAPDICSQTDAELEANTKAVAVSIVDQGIVNYFKGGISNIMLFILALVGLGSVIVRLTPSKDDDLWYEKYILKPVRFIGKFISFGIGSAPSNPGKK